MKYQFGIIRKGGTINSLTLLTNNHTSGTKQKGQTLEDCL